jgi:hypothetical protein
MCNLTIDTIYFTNISLAECLNYPVFTNLEYIVKHYVISINKQICSKKYNYDSNDKIEYFLQQMLLRLAGNPVWLSIQNGNNLDQYYLYKVIRKNLFIVNPKFI